MGVWERERTQLNVMGEPRVVQVPGAPQVSSVGTAAPSIPTLNHKEQEDIKRKAATPPPHFAARTPFIRNRDPEGNFVKPPLRRERLH